MKRFAFFFASAVLLVSSISAFAYGKPVSSTDMNSGPTVTLVNQAMSDQPWVGKTADQLIAKMGNPSSILDGANGDKLHAYDQLIPRDGRAPDRTRRVEFDVASDGSITSVTSSIS